MRTQSRHPFEISTARSRWAFTRRRGPLSAVLGIFLLCGFLGEARAEATAISREYQIKAAFLFNFTKFVEWPPKTFPDESSPIVIGVLGRNPFGGELDKIANGRTVNGRAVQVRLISTASEVFGVQVLFVPAGEESRLRASAWRNAPVVVVGESNSFAALGGLITFTREADKVRFSINLESADRAGLKISAQLLKLAADVHRTP